jgi:hypothetical protein
VPAAAPVIDTYAYMNICMHIYILIRTYIHIYVHIYVHKSIVANKYEPKEKNDDQNRVIFLYRIYIQS